MVRFKQIQCLIDAEPRGFQNRNDNYLNSSQRFSYLEIKEFEYSSHSHITFVTAYCIYVPQIII